MQKSMTATSSRLAGWSGKTSSALRAALTEAACLGERGLEHAVPLHQPHRLVEVAVILVEILQGALPEGALVGIGTGNSQHHRQRHLALAEVVADGLAQKRWLAA